MLEDIDTSQGRCAKGIEDIPELNEDKEQMQSPLDA